MLYLQNKKSLFDMPLDKKYVVKFLKRDKTIKISLLYDTMFKTMFQNENRIKYPCKFISTLFNNDYNYLLNNLKLCKNEADKNKESDKAERCDFIARINEEMVNIEVNNNSSVEVMERNIEFASRIYSHKVKSGKKYKYTKTYQININNFAFKGNDKTIDTYYLMNDEGIILTKKLQIILIYVPNIRKKWYTLGIESLTDLEKFILVMIEQDINIAKEISKGDELMEEYVNESIDVSNYNFGESYDKEKAYEEQVYNDGIEIGFNQGIKQKGIEIAKNLLKQNIDIKIISLATGLTEKQINKLK